MQHRGVRASRLVLLLLIAVGWLGPAPGEAFALQVDGPHVAVHEGEDVEFRVRREPGDPEQIRLDVVGEGATPGADVDATPIVMGRFDFEFRVRTLRDDVLHEPDERFALRTPDGRVLASAVVRDVPAPLGSWGPSSTTYLRADQVGYADERTGAVRIAISVDNRLERPVRVAYRTEDGIGARAGVDYEARAGELEVGPGTSKQEVVVPFVDDAVHELPEDLVLVLSGEGAREISERFVIADDDWPRLSADAQPTPEGDGPGAAHVRLRLSGPSEVAQTVVLRPVGSAGSPGYATSEEEVPEGDVVATFAPGQLEAEVAVPIIGDQLDEADEEFLVMPLSDTGVGVPLELTVVPLKILDDDGPAVSLGAPRLDGAGALVVDVACASVAGTCEGSARAALAGTAFASVAPGPARAFRAPDARRRTVRLRLPARARARLRARRSVRVRTTVRATGADGDVSVRARTARVRLRR